MKPVILIPARMASTRLPGKPLADIAGVPMIVRVAERAAAAGIGPVAVATDSPEIARTVQETGHKVVMTSTHHESGSDRIFEALNSLDPHGIHDAVINLQGDLPLVDPACLATAAQLLDASGADITTLATPITDEAEKADPNTVKIAGAPLAGHADALACLYFSRSCVPWGDGPVWHHIGIYAYRRDALARFVALPPSVLERRERLEQLRALEAGMRITAAIVDTMPMGVDTPADLERARALASPPNNV